MMINTGNMIQVADLLAYTAHSAIDQRRKYTNEPYIVHPRAVSLLVHSYFPADLELQCAALLHDVVEDTHITNDYIRQVLGSDIAKLVEEVTDVAKPADGNRATRMRMNINHLATASARGQTLKACDIIDNLSTVLVRDPTFAPVYAREKRETLTVLTKAHPEALERAWSIVRGWEEQQVQNALASPRFSRGRRYGKKVASSKESSST